jgi:hypothetical protein
MCGEDSNLPEIGKKERRIYFSQNRKRKSGPPFCYLIFIQKLPKRSGSITRSRIICLKCLSRACRISVQTVINRTANKNGQEQRNSINKRKKYDGMDGTHCGSRITFHKIGFRFMIGLF